MPKEKDSNTGPWGRGMNRNTAAGHQGSAEESGSSSDAYAKGILH